MELIINDNGIKTEGLTVKQLQDILSIVDGYSIPNPTSMKEDHSKDDVLGCSASLASNLRLYLQGNAPQRFIGKRDKIADIKMVRHFSNATLKDAKTWCEANLNYTYEYTYSC